MRWREVFALNIDFPPTSAMSPLPHSRFPPPLPFPLELCLLLFCSCPEVDGEVTHFHPTSQAEVPGKIFMKSILQTRLSMRSSTVSRFQSLLLSGHMVIKSGEMTYLHCD